MNEEIKKLKAKIEKLQVKLYQLEQKSSSYYIGIVTFGDDDHWVDYCYQIGFVTEAQAKEWRNKRYTERDVYSAGYRAVTKDVYNKIEVWESLYRLYKAINRRYPEIDELDGIDVIEEGVRSAIKKICREIGIEDLEFMHPGN